MSFQIPIVHLPRSITFASYIAFSASKGYLTLTWFRQVFRYIKTDPVSTFRVKAKVLPKL